MRRLTREGGGAVPPFQRPGLPSPSSTAAGVAAVGRALTVLAAFRPGDSGLPLRVLATRTGLYKSTILRLLASLERASAVRRNPDGTWSPGPILVHWSSLYVRGLGLEAVVPPALEALAEVTGGTATFWVRLDEERRLCLYRAAAPRAVRVAVQPGDVLPLGAGATSRVFLRWGSEEDGASGSAPPEAIVSQGVRDVDPAAVSAPVFGAGGLLRGALTVSGSSERLWPDVERVRALVADAAAGLTRASGG